MIKRKEDKITTGAFIIINNTEDNTWIAAPIFIVLLYIMGLLAGWVIW